jgi:hypothetical protein
MSATHLVKEELILVLPQDIPHRLSQLMLMPRVPSDEVLHVHYRRVSSSSLALSAESAGITGPQTDLRLTPTAEGRALEHERLAIESDLRAFDL